MKKLVIGNTVVKNTRGAYHLTEKSGWGVESIMVSDLPVNVSLELRRN